MVESACHNLRQLLEAEPALRHSSAVCELRAWLDDDDEAPPPPARHHVDDAEAKLRDGDADAALDIVDRALALNPDSARALRLRARVHWHAHRAELAYKDMCDAQRIDYDEASHALHEEMRLARTPATPPAPAASPAPATPPAPAASPALPDELFAGLGDLFKDPAQMEAMLNNPELIGMAQRMMQDPSVLQSMLGGITQNRAP